MAEIVAFPMTPADPLVWQCGCGSTSFRLRSDAVAVCQGCGAIACDGGGWRAALPDEGVRHPDDADVRTVVSLCSPAAALKGMLARATPEALAAVVTIEKTGYTRVWSDVETGEQRAWLSRRMLGAMDMMGCDRDDG